MNFRVQSFAALRWLWIFRFLAFIFIDRIIGTLELIFCIFACAQCFISRCSYKGLTISACEDSTISWASNTLTLGGAPLELTLSSETVNCKLKKTGEKQFTVNRNFCSLIGPWIPKPFVQKWGRYSSGMSVSQILKLLFSTATSVFLCLWHK